ncbi:peptidoglycan DD-metalloendopeptidase family protein [Catenovulum sp. 2E275]|uniref:murein hydrolase activator EnvC family protein n=1 Tax=Catenovulum sp. 2E275 TaxID=2980497 RepID=UPI0021CE8A3A|nr:peptidoglycan DD-metalloendopeptidase family protein [Catenovulum sp. 2E275]MCU4677184.1 peptidoglycan DD-metalloendopeptidase family protein [Catenovulum sp. 2E275]
MFKPMNLHRFKNKTARSFSGCLLFLLLCFQLFWTNSSLAASEAQTKAKLEKVQQQILQTQTDLKQNSKQLNQIEQALKKTDRAIGQVTNELRKTESSLVQTKQQIKELEQQQKELEAIKAEQLNILSAQIKSAYQVGQHDYLKMMLNQDSPATLERMLSYYQYLNQARLSAIDKLKITLAALEQNKLVLNQTQQELAQLLQLQTDKKAELVNLKAQQKENLLQLSQIIKTDEQQLANLKQDENALTAALEALAEAVEALPEQLDFSGLSQVKGKLLWPTKGQVKDYFGRTKSGQLRWKGIVINAPSGQLINNIYAGRVIFSDWLKGYGLVLVVEHGDGFMSLYGHNQALLKEVGDIVRAGEPIALVGQSGGQNTPGLYFEIRHQGKPVDPTKWCN